MRLSSAQGFIAKSSRLHMILYRICQSKPKFRNAVEFSAYSKRVVAGQNPETGLDSLDTLRVL